MSKVSLSTLANNLHDTARTARGRLQRTDSLRGTFLGELNALLAGFSKDTTSEKWPITKCHVAEAEPLDRSRLRHVGDSLLQIGDTLDSRSESLCMCCMCLVCAHHY